MLPSKLIQTIEQTKVPNNLAVFDADGTLWPEDVGYDFFRYQIKNNLIPKPSWADQFDDIYHNNATQACAKIVQSNKGVSLSDYRKWFRDFLKENPLNIFPFQEELLKKLSELGITTYVISASPQWLIEEAILYYKLPFNKVIGIQTEISNNKITDKLIYPLSIKEGKVEGLLKETNSVYPFFSASNSISDLALMECATHIRWVVALAKKGERQFQSEQKLLQLAKEKSWFYTE